VRSRRRVETKVLQKVNIAHLSYAPRSPMSELPNTPRNRIKPNAEKKEALEINPPSQTRTYHQPIVPEAGDAVPVSSWVGEKNRTFLEGSIHGADAAHRVNPRTPAPLATLPFRTGQGTGNEGPIRDRRRLILPLGGASQAV
jgi:hypothetical protein